MFAKEKYDRDALKTNHVPRTSQSSQTLCLLDVISKLNIQEENLIEGGWHVPRKEKGLPIHLALVHQSMDKNTDDVSE
jgi:hypothetical protein